MSPTLPGTLPSARTAELLLKGLTVTLELDYTHFEARANSAAYLSGSIRNNNFKTSVYVNALQLTVDEPITASADLFEMFVAPIRIEAGQCVPGLQLGELQIPYDCVVGEYGGRVKVLGGLFGDDDTFRGARQVLGECPLLIRVLA